MIASTLPVLGGAERVEDHWEGLPRVIVVVGRCCPGWAGCERLDSHRGCVDELPERLRGVVVQGFRGVVGGGVGPPVVAEAVQRLLHRVLGHGDVAGVEPDPARPARQTVQCGDDFMSDTDGRLKAGMGCGHQLPWGDLGEQVGGLLPVAACSQRVVQLLPQVG